MSDATSPDRAGSRSSPQAGSAVVVARLGRGARARLLRLLGGLGEAVARVVVIEAGDESATGAGEASFGGFLHRVRAGAGGERAVREAVLGRGQEAPAAVVVVVDGALESWSAEEVDLVDAAAVASVVELGAVAGWLENDGVRFREGLVLVPGARWRELGPAPPAAVGGLPVERWRSAGAPVVDLRALARLAELGVPSSAITAELAGGLTRLRDRLALWSPRLDRRFALDACRIPGEVVEGEPVHLELAGWIARLPRPERLELRIGSRRVGLPVEIPRPDVLARFPDLADDRCGFRLDRPLPGLPAGRHGLSLSLPGRRFARRLGAVEVVRRPVAAAEAAAPTSSNRSTAGGGGELLVHEMRAVAAATGRWRLELAGELRGASGLDSLTLAVDGRQQPAIDPRAFEPVATAPGEPERQRFQIETPLGEGLGSREVELRAVKGGRSIAEWRGTLVLPEPGEPRLEWRCPALDRLRRESPAWVHGALVLEGALLGAPAGAELVLEIDGEPVASGSLAADGSFRLVHRSRADGGPQGAECVARLGPVELARRGPFRFVTRATAVPEIAIADLDRIRAALAPRLAALDGLESTALLRALFELRAEERGAIQGALTELTGRLRAAERRPAVLGEELPAAAGERLRVLFVAWEIPWSGHGGGVCMVHLLRHLGARHDVTLLHPVHPGAEGLSEEVRAEVAEIVTVPRGWHAVPQPAPFGVPHDLLRTYSPELRAAVAAELDAGAYDLVNYEYFGCALHAPPRRGPDLLAFYESMAFAALAEAPERFADEHEAASWTGRWLSALHFETVRTGGRFPRLVALTEPEARLLAPFLPGGHVAVHPIPIDSERLSARAADAARPSEQTFVYVGTFRHPPNLAAARELIEEIAPRLRLALPGSRLVLVGERPPEAIERAASAAGVECPGWVDDLPRLLGSATGFLAPIRSGGGMRVKLLEAMACGCPVVTTRLGMSGIAARPEAEFLEAGSVEEFVTAARRLAGEPGLADRLAAAGRALVARSHDPATVAERRERAWRSAVAASPPGR